MTRASETPSRSPFLWPATLALALGTAVPALADDGSVLWRKQVFWNPDGAFDEMGHSVAIHGDLMVVGRAEAPSAYGAYDCGQVRVYRYDVWRWVLEAELAEPDEVADSDYSDARLGHDVDVWEDPATGEAHIIAGAPGYKSGGAALTWRYDPWSGDWEFDGLLEGTGSEFGVSVAIDGEKDVDWAVVGETGGNGMVYVFRRLTTESWVTADGAPFTNPVDGNFMNFGWAVDIEGNWIVVGDPYVLGDDDEANRGAAYVYWKNPGTYEGSEWELEQELLPAADLDTYAFYGGSVAIRGDTILVGRPGPSYIDTIEGSVFVWSRITTHDWEESGELTPADGHADDHFGQSVALDHDLILVGAPGFAAAGIADAGKVYRFSEDDLAACGGYENPQPRAEDEFGCAVAVRSKCSLAVGARYDSELNDYPKAGAVHILSCAWAGGHAIGIFDTPGNLHGGIGGIVFGNVLGGNGPSAKVWEELPDLEWDEDHLPDLGAWSRISKVGGQTGEEIAAGVVKAPGGPELPALWRRDGGQWVLELLPLPSGSTLLNVFDVDLTPQYPGYELAVVGATTKGATLWVKENDQWKAKVLPGLAQGAAAFGLALDLGAPGEPAVAGWAEDAQGTRFPVLWDHNGQVYDIGLIPWIPGVSDWGEVTGVFRDSIGERVLLGRVSDGIGGKLPVLWEFAPQGWALHPMQTEAEVPLTDLVPIEMAPGGTFGPVLGKGLGPWGGERAVIWEPLATGGALHDMTALLDSAEVGVMRSVWGLDESGRVFGNVTLPADPTGLEFPAVFDAMELVGRIGTSFCGPAVPNSTGAPGRIEALGSDEVADGDVTLLATDLPQNMFGMFLVGQAEGAIQPPGSQGILCLSGFIGRYNQEVQNAGPAGAFALSLDLEAVPWIGGTVAVQPGETWLFTTWYRDLNPGLTSNFTDGVRITFE